ncbi:MAG: hypothetical protein F2661_01215 [Actinobacteria bacterium]|nr:hypothetical protein [Actinomycetota bacterium]
MISDKKSLPLFRLELFLDGAGTSIPISKSRSNKCRECVSASMIKSSAALIPFSFAESIMRFATGEYRTAE